MVLAVLAVALPALTIACDGSDGGTDLPRLRQLSILDEPPEAKQIGRIEARAADAGIVAISSPAAIEIVYATSESVGNLRRYYRAQLREYDRVFFNGIPTPTHVVIFGRRSDPQVRASVYIDARKPIVQHLQSSDLDEPPTGTLSYVTVRVDGGE